MANIFYNRYHKKNTRIQKKIISRENFTYRTLVSLLDSHIQSHFRVLDVGCGVGTIDFYIASRIKSLVGIDVSSRAIDLARLSSKSLGFDNLKYICFDLDNILFRKYKSDLVICSEVIEHVENDEKLINNIASSLSSGGILIISTPSVNAPLYRLGLLDKFDKKVGHLRRYSQDSLVKLLVNNNFSIQKVLLTEGILRNCLFTSKKMGWVIKFLKYPLSVGFNFIDDLLIKLFGESNIYIVCRKI